MDEVIINITETPEIVTINVSELGSKGDKGDTGTDHFVGKYLTLLALQAAHATADDGDYGIVDLGGGSNAILYIWDAQEGWIAMQGGSGSGSVNSVNDIPPDEFGNVELTLPVIKPVHVTFPGGEVDLTNLISEVEDVYTVDSNITLTAKAGAVNNYSWSATLKGDGTHTINFGVFTNYGNYDFDSTTDMLNDIMCFKIRGSYYYTIIKQYPEPIIIEATVVTLTQDTPNAINIDWIAKTGSVGYNVYLSDDNVTYDDPIYTTEITYNIAGLVVGSSKYAYVICVGDGSIYRNSVASNVDNLTLQPEQLATPTLVATAISSTQIDLTLGVVDNDVSKKLELSEDGISGWTQIGGTIDPATTLYQNTGLIPNTHYYYRHQAIGDGVNYLNSGYSTDDAITSLNQLAAPVVTISNPANGTLKLDWADVENEVGYDVYRSTNDIDYTKQGSTLAAGTITWSNTSLADGLYYYKLKAIASGEYVDSEFSNVVSFDINSIIWNILTHITESNKILTFAAGETLPARSGASTKILQGDKIICSYPTASWAKWAIGFSLTNTTLAWNSASFKYGFYWSAGTVARIINGVLTNLGAGTYTAGDTLMLERSGTTILLKRYTGGAWSTLYTFTGATATEYYLVTDNFEVGASTDSVKVEKE